MLHYLTDVPFLVPCFLKHGQMPRVIPHNDGGVVRAGEAVRSVDVYLPEVKITRYFIHAHGVKSHLVPETESDGVRINKFQGIRHRVAIRRDVLARDHIVVYII